MATQQGVIKNFMASLDTTTLKGKNALDQAIKYCSNFSGIQDVIDRMVSDCKNAKSGDDFLKTYCGINLDNEDTGAITGSDAGGTTVKTTESVVPEEGAIESFNGDSFTLKSGLIIQLASYENKYTPISYKDLTPAQQYIWWAVKKWWANSAIKLITDSYGNNFGFDYGSDATVDKIYFGFFNDPGGALEETNWRYDTNNGDSRLIQINVNMGYYGSLQNGGNKDGKTTGYGKDGADYCDRTFTHEFTHAAMAAHVKHCYYLPSFIKEGMAELTIGIDNWRTPSLKALAGNSSLLRQSLTLNEDYATVSGVDSPSYAGGYMFFRYLARQAGDLNLNNTSSSKVLKTFMGNDSITNTGNNTTIDSGAGYDEITVSGGSNVSVNSGAGGDYVAVGSSAKKVTIFSSAGNNFINNWGSSDTVNLGSGADTVYNSSLASSCYISSGAGNDSISNYGANTFIDGGNDKDLISNIAASKVTITSGAGDDTVWNWSNVSGKTTGTNVSISTGAGNDTIWNDGASATIIAGAGNDTVTSYGSNVLLVYNNGDGNDSINGFNATSTLSIAGVNFSSTKSGNNVVVTVGNGKITLVGAASLSKVNIVGESDGKLVQLTDGNNNYANTVSGATIMALGGADSIYNNASNVKIYGGTGNDTLGISSSSSFVTADVGDGNNYIYNWGKNDKIICAGGKDTVYNASLASNAVIELGGGNDSVYNSGTKSTIIGGAGSDTVYNYGGVNMSIDGGNDNDLISNLYANKTTILGGAGNDTVWNWNGNVSGKTAGANVSISAGAGNDTIWNGGASATIIAGTGSDTVTNSGANVLFVYNNGDGNDSINGFNATSTLSIAGGKYTSKKSGNNVVVTVGNGKVTLVGAASLSKVNIKGTLDGGGSDTLPTGGSTITNRSSNASLKSGNTNDLISNISASKVTITSGAGNDTVWNWNGNVSGKTAGANVSISAGAGNDTIWNGGASATIIAGTGSDTVTNSGANVLFVYNNGDGNDSINGFNATSTLSIAGGKYSSTKSGNNVIVTVGNGKVTLVGAASLSKVNIKGTLSGGGSDTLPTGGSTLTITNSTKSPVTLSSAYTNANASKRTSAVKITGNSLANSISGGSKNDSIYGGTGNDSILGNAGNDKIYGEAGNDLLRGGAGNDSLWGGAGNDTLFGDAGNDTFIYANGDGKDVICGFETGDLLSITGTFSGTYNSSKKEIYFKVGSTANAITLKDFTATSFNINGENYGISGSRIVKK